MSLLRLLHLSILDTNFGHYRSKDVMTEVSNVSSIWLSIILQINTLGLKKVDHLKRILKEIGIIGNQLHTSMGFVTLPIIGEVALEIQFGNGMNLLKR